MTGRSPSDRDNQPLEKGDRVRIVQHVGWRDIEGRKTRLLGEYAYVRDADRETSVGIRLEEHAHIDLTVQSHQVALAPGMLQPEIEEPQLAQSSSDVRLIERYPSYGRPQYSTYAIGEGEGEATLMYARGCWELTYADLGVQDYEGDPAGADDDRPGGAWAAWTKARAQAERGR